MKTEQQLRDLLARMEGFVNRIESFMEQNSGMLTLQDTFVIGQAIEGFSRDRKLLHWIFEEAESNEITDEERAAGYVTFDEYMTAGEEYINRLYSRSKEYRDAVHSPRREV